MDFDDDQARLLWVRLVYPSSHDRASDRNRNFLRDYSQAVDVGTLKGVQADTVCRLLCSNCSINALTSLDSHTSVDLGLHVLWICDQGI